MNINRSRPPLGVLPRYIVETRRALDILEAMHRLLTSGVKVPAAWVEELGDMTTIFGRDEERRGIDD